MVIYKLVYQYDKISLRYNHNKGTLYARCYYQTIKKNICSFDSVELSYLFGSFVTYKISNHIDIAIYSKEGFDSFYVGGASAL